MSSPQCLGSFGVRSASLLAIGLFLIPGVARAQTPLTAIGLGYPVVPVDGRAAGLGGTGLGLLGGSFSLINPADMTQHTSPSFGLSFAGEEVDIEGGRAPIDIGRQRFTVIRAMAPYRGWSLGIAFGGAFDQDWTVRFQDTLHLFDGDVPFEETREHDGGISTIDFSAARRVGHVSLGVSAQRLTGSLRQTFNRAFKLPKGEAPSLGATGGSTILSYGAWRFKMGAGIQVGDRFMVSGVVTLPSTLTVERQDSTRASVDVDLPASVEVGASARVTSNLLVAGSAGWGGWSDVGDIRDSQSHDITWFGAGLEYTALTLFGGELPVRLGARRTELPFSLGDEALDETAITGGFGWIFRGGAAEVNLGIEVGTRGDILADGVEEGFQRFTVSFSLRQFARSF